MSQQVMTDEKIRIVLFKTEHLEVADVRGFEKYGLLALPDTEQRLKHLEKASDAMTLIYDGRILTCAGFIQMWPGVCELWQIPTVYAPKYPRIFITVLRNYVENIAKTFYYHRVQTICLDDELHNRWMNFIGFKKEGVAQQYSFQKEDYCMYARLFTWE